MTNRILPAEQKDFICRAPNCLKLFPDPDARENHEWLTHRWRAPRFNADPAPATSHETLEEKAAKFLLDVIISDASSPGFWTDYHKKVVTLLADFACMVALPIVRERAELLSALKVITKAYRACYPSEEEPAILPESIKQAEAAIAKAEGRQ